MKAIVCQRTGELAPYIHDLVRLAGIAGVDLDPGRRDVLAKMNAYALAGRYPDTLGTTLTSAETDARVLEAREVFNWLMTLLPARSGATFATLVRKASMRRLLSSSGRLPVAKRGSGATSTFSCFRPASMLPSVCGRSKRCGSLLDE